MASGTDDEGEETKGNEAGDEVTEVNDLADAEADDEAEYDRFTS